MRILVAFGAGLLAFGCGGDPRVIAVGQRIHHDDFEYSVRGVETRGQIGALVPSGRFHLVTFQVENRAGRVNHAWDNTIAYLVDDQGRISENHTAAQLALARTTPFAFRARYVTPAETTDTTILVFDVPTNARELYLKVRGDILMGDVFDGGQFTRTRVRLF